MRRILLVATLFLATAATAWADHGPRGGHRGPACHVPPPPPLVHRHPHGLGYGHDRYYRYARPYQYRYGIVPYHPYAYPHASGFGLGVQGRHFSLYLDF